MLNLVIVTCRRIYADAGEFGWGLFYLTFLTDSKERMTIQIYLLLWQSENDSFVFIVMQLGKPDRGSLASLLLARAINIIGLFSLSAASLYCISTSLSLESMYGEASPLLFWTLIIVRRKNTLACDIVVLILVWLIFTVSCPWSVYWMDDRARCNRPKVFPPPFLLSLGWIVGWMIPEITLEKNILQISARIGTEFFRSPVGCLQLSSSSSLPECPFTFLCPATSGGAIDSCFKLFPDDKIFAWCLRVVKSWWHCYY